MNLQKLNTLSPEIFKEVLKTVQKETKVNGKGLLYAYPYCLDWQRTRTRTPQCCQYPGHQYVQDEDRTISFKYLNFKKENYGIKIL